MNLFSRTTKTVDLAKRFLALGTFNVVLSVIFSAVILDPFLCVSVSPGQFGCHDNMVTSWPGTWLFIGYFTWLIVGVLGSFGWAGLFYLGDTLRGKTEVNAFFSRVHVIAFEVGVLGRDGLHGGCRIRRRRRSRHRGRRGGRCGGDIARHLPALSRTTPLRSSTTCPW